MESEAVTIIIRTQNQSFPDLRVKIFMNSTVRELKKKIELEHQDSPKVASQKLIYNGKILNDQQCMGTVVKESDVVIHLAYALVSADGNKKEIPSKPATPQTTELRHRFQPQVPAPAASMSAVNDYNGYQQAYAAWMEQYQQQYSSYMQYYSGLRNPYVTLSPTVQPQLDAPQEGDTEVPAPAAQGQEQQAQDMNGGLVVADENIQADWFDALFALTRFFLMISMIYFYSTTYRFVIAMTVLVLVYLYQAGVLQIQRRQVQAQNDVNNDDPQQADDNNNNDADSTDEDGAEQSEQTVARPPPSIFATAACFVRSFFSSLIPTGPPGVVN